MKILIYRIRIYSLLSNIFLHCDFPKQLKKLKEIISRGHCEVASSDRSNLEKTRRLLRFTRSDSEQEVILDFTQLFLGTKKCLVPPYQSVWRSSKRLVMQKQTEQVRQAYLEAGLKVKNQGLIPDDHLGIELEFMAFLWTKMLETKQNQDKKSYNKFLKLKNKFLKEHLLLWVPSFCDELVKHSFTNFYRATGFLLKSLIIPG